MLSGRTRQSMVSKVLRRGGSEAVKAPTKASAMAKIERLTEV
jgi:hypothetical protein